MAEEDRFRVPLDGEMIKVLASDTRRSVLQLLKRRRMTLSEMARELDLKKSTVLEHMQRLTDAGLVSRDEDEDRLWVYYDLTRRGRSILSPSKSRLYLAVGLATAAAAAAVVLFFGLQAILAPAVPGPTPTEGGLPPTAASGDRVAADGTWFRGLSGPVVEETPAEGTASLVPEDGGPPVLTVAVQGGTVRFPAGQLDTVPPGSYRIQLRADDERRTLDGTLDIVRPTVSVRPADLTAGVDNRLRVAVSAEESWTGELPVRVDGTPVDTEPASGGVFEATVNPAAAGSVQVHVGRLPAATVPVDPYLQPTFTVDEGPRMELGVTDARGDPVGDVGVRLNGRAVGFTGSDGRLEIDVPSSGRHALGLTDPSGRSIARPIAVEGWNVTDAAWPLQVRPRPDAGPEDRVRVDVTVRNDAAAEARVAVAASVAPETEVSRPVAVPAHANRTVVLEPRVPGPGAADLTTWVGSSDRTPLVFRNATRDGTEGAPPAQDQDEVQPFLVDASIPSTAFIRTRLEPDVRVTGLAVADGLEDPAGPISVPSDGRVNLTVTLRNRGVVAGNTTVELRVDGRLSRSVPVTVGAANRTEIDLPVQLDTPGRHTVEVADRSLVLRVEGVDAAEKPTIPGFEGLGALAAVGAALWLSRRR